MMTALSSLCLYLAVSRARHAARAGRSPMDAAREAAEFFDVDYSGVFDRARVAERECAAKRAELRQKTKRRA